MFSLFYLDGGLASQGWNSSTSGPIGQRKVVRTPIQLSSLSPCLSVSSGSPYWFSTTIVFTRVHRTRHDTGVLWLNSLLEPEVKGLNDLETMYCPDSSNPPPTLSSSSSPPPVKLHDSDDNLLEDRRTHRLTTHSGSDLLLRHERSPNSQTPSLTTKVLISLLSREENC